MEERSYPYLGVTRTTNGQEYVVFFLEKDYGVIVMSEVTGNDSLLPGSTTYDFDESRFEYLNPEVSVRLNNAPLD